MLHAGASVQAPARVPRFCRDACFPWRAARSFPRGDERFRNSPYHFRRAPPTALLSHGRAVRNRAPVSEIGQCFTPSSAHGRWLDAVPRPACSRCGCCVSVALHRPHAAGSWNTETNETPRARSAGRRTRHRARRVRRPWPWAGPGNEGAAPHDPPPFEAGVPNLGISAGPDGGAEATGGIGAQITLPSGEIVAVLSWSITAPGADPSPYRVARSTSRTASSQTSTSGTCRRRRVTRSRFPRRRSTAASPAWVRRSSAWRRARRRRSASRWDASLRHPGSPTLAASIARR